MPPSSQTTERKHDTYNGNWCENEEEDEKKSIGNVAMVSQEQTLYWFKIMKCSMFDLKFVWGLFIVHYSIIMKPLNAGDGYKPIS